MATSGQAGATQRAKNSASNAFEAFIECSNKYDGGIASLAGEVVCDPSIWLEFAHWLVHTADLKGSTCVEYMRKVLGLARDRWSNEYPDFFVVLDESSDRRVNWLKGMIREVHAEKFRQHTLKGTNSALEQYTITLDPHSQPSLSSLLSYSLTGYSLSLSLSLTYSLTLTLTTRSY